MPNWVDARFWTRLDLPSSRAGAGVLRSSGAWEGPRTSTHAPVNISHEPLGFAGLGIFRALIAASLHPGSPQPCAHGDPYSSAGAAGARGKGLEHRAKGGHAACPPPLLIPFALREDSSPVLAMGPDCLEMGGSANGGRDHA